MAAVLSSCQKSELESVSVNDGKDIVLNISVSNPGADDTKALIKTGWAANDEISIWYDSNVQETPDLVVKYDGAKWIQKEGATVSGNTPSEGDNKYAKALYNGTVKVASKDDYTYENSTLTFSIENWTFLTEVQVVVKGLTSASAGSYTLACDKFTPLAAGNGYTVGSDAITASAGTKGAAVTGISNTDGVAFVFATADYSTTAADYKFTLKDNTSGSEVTKVYKPNVAIAAKENKSSIKALTIESGSFTAPGPEYVTIGNLKWATMNLGAEKETDYGYYFAWGATELAYSSLSSDKFTFVTSRPDSYGGSGWTQSSGFAKVNTPYYNGSNYEKYTGSSGDKKDKLESGDDVAAKLWGGNWRMPTSQEFKDLADACGGSSSYNTSKKPGKDTNVDKGIYWCTNYDGVAGCLFCDGTNKLFFSAAGYGNGTDLINAGSHGRYWSSSLSTGDTGNAYYLYFNSGNVNPQSNFSRYLGFSVRPVSD